MSTAFPRPTSVRLADDGRTLVLRYGSVTIAAKVASVLSFTEEFGCDALPDPLALIGECIAARRLELIAQS